MCIRDSIQAVGGLPHGDLFRRFHAFGDDGQIQAVGHIHHRFHDLHALAAVLLDVYKRQDFHHEMSSGLTTALEFLMSAEIAKTFLLQNLESVVPLAATFALRAMRSLMLHWEMQGGHRSGRKKAENDTEAEKND